MIRQATYSHFKIPVKGLLSLGIVLCLFYIIHKEVRSLTDIEIDPIFFSKAYVIRHIHFMILCTVLLVANVFCEATKWQMATQYFIQQSKAKSIRAVLFGNTLGFVTPSKVGEYAGRLLHTSKQKSLKGLLANLYCSLSQNIVNILIGLLAFGLNPSFNSLINRYLTSSFFTLGIVFTFVLVLVYFNLEVVIEKASKVEILKKRLDALGFEQFDEAIDRQTLTQMLAWSFLRYVVYAAQYILVCHYFDFDTSLLNMLSGVSFIFLIQSALILPPVLGLLARGEIAIVVWSLFAISTDQILLSTFSLWIINILVPAVIGLIVLLVPVGGEKPSSETNQIT
ncbi:MAG TPA: lysylphosphatidylglycerol synthase domain-containing protein [Saprospiraceae bacterium]|nr:lysylphosphatidylglycerol synthase domain-containing protein [Saprospiraceae bacterium]HPN68805.1 lysylphosphatidylglycerol synthase domain-containing protein [Saprospiraceae bacterium]